VFISKTYLQFLNHILGANIFFVYFTMFSCLHIKLTICDLKKNTKWVKFYLLLLFILYVVPIFPKIVYIVLCFHRKLNYKTQMEFAYICKANYKDGDSNIDQQTSCYNYINGKLYNLFSKAPISLCGCSFR